MKHLIKSLLVVTIVTLAASCTQKKSDKKENIVNSTTQLQKGYIETTDFGKYKVHTYFTKDLMNDISLVFEHEGKALIIDSPAFWDNFDEFSKYLSNNKIKVEGMLLPYHPLGASFLKTPSMIGVKTYTTQHVLDYFNTGYGSTMKVGIPKAFGDKIDSTFYTNNIILEEGKNELAGFNINLVKTYDGFDIEFPESQTVYTHILGHDVHSEIISKEQLDSSIKNFKDYLSKGYIHFYSSHYAPENKADMETKISYLENLKKIIAASKTAEEFSKNIKAAYPNYKENYLQITINAFYGSKK